MGRIGLLAAGLAAAAAFATFGASSGWAENVVVSYTCPLKFDPQQSLPDGSWTGQRNEPQRLKQTSGKGRLDGIWIISGKRGDELAEAPAILVPDRADGGWDLTAEADGVLLVCLYRGLENYVATTVPSGVFGCFWNAHYDSNRLATNPKVSCR